MSFEKWQISEQVFEIFRKEMPPKKPKRDRFLGLAPLAEIPKREPKVYDANGFRVNPKPLKKRSTVTVSRGKFLDVVCQGLAQYKYLGPKQRQDLIVACRYEVNLYSTYRNILSSTAGPLRMCNAQL